MEDLLKKWIIIRVVEVEDEEGNQLPGFDIMLGLDILKSNDDYFLYDQTLVATKDEVLDAITEYMSEKYPDVFYFEFDSEFE